MVSMRLHIRAIVVIVVVLLSVLVLSITWVYHNSLEKNNIHRNKSGVPSNDVKIRSMNNINSISSQFDIPIFNNPIHIEYSKRDTSKGSIFTMEYIILHFPSNNEFDELTMISRPNRFIPIDITPPKIFEDGFHPGLWETIPENDKELYIYGYEMLNVLRSNNTFDKYTYKTRGQYYSVGNKTGIYGMLMDCMINKEHEIEAICKIVVNKFPFKNKSEFQKELVEESNIFEKGNRARK